MAEPAVISAGTLVIGTPAGRLEPTRRDPDRDDGESHELAPSRPGGDELVSWISTMRWPCGGGSWSSSRGTSRRAAGRSHGPGSTRFPFGGGGSRRLVDRSRGIWNPSDLAGTLSIISDPRGPYDDRDDVALSEELRLLADPLDPTPAQRRYVERVAWQRLHQPEFRVRVLRAYETRCSVCALRRPELLDAAHIVGDLEDRGDPVIPNGLSMCKIHHAAFDRNLLGITPDREVRVNAELLEEIDGPMLQHGLKEMHQRTITVPLCRADQPDRERLDVRYRRLEAS